MHIYSLFEIFLVVFTVYALLNFEGPSRVVVSIACLVTVFLCERLQKRIKEDEEVRKRLLRYRMQDHRKKLREKEEAAEKKRVTEQEVEAPKKEPSMDDTVKIGYRDIKRAD